MVDCDKRLPFILDDGNMFIPGWSSKFYLLEKFSKTYNDDDETQTCSSSYRQT